MEGQPERARRFVLFFNDGASLPSGMDGARRAAVEFLTNNGAPGDLFAIASSEEHHRFRLLQDFSSDRGKVIATLRRSLVDPGRVSSLVLEMERPAPDGAEGKAGAKGPAGDRAREWEAWSAMIGKQVRSSGRSVVNGLEALISWLSAYPGPRSILYFGDGLPGVTRRDIEDLTGAAAASSVTVHAANTRGLAGSGGDSDLATLAAETGGLRSNSNDAFALFRDVDAESKGAYVLSFAPVGEADGRSHSLRLSCTRHGVHLRHRQTFVRETPEQARRRMIESAFIAPELHAAFALDAMVPSRETGGRDLLLYVPAGRLLFVPGGSSSTARVEVGAVALDEQGQEVGRMSRRVEIHLGREAGPAPPAINLTVRGAVPAAAKSVTAVVSDLQSGVLGASRVRTDWESHADRLAGLALGLPGERSLWISTEASGAGDKGVSPAVQAARRMRFTTSEIPICEVMFADARPEGGRGLRIVLTEGTATALVLPLDEAEIVKTRGPGTVLAARLPLRDVPAGDLLLTLEETGPDGPVERGRLPLRVVPPAGD
jgi:VWFA-related protein